MFIKTRKFWFCQRLISIHKQILHQDSGPGIQARVDMASHLDFEALVRYTIKNLMESENKEALNTAEDLCKKYFSNLKK